MMLTLTPDVMISIGLLVLFIFSFMAAKVAGGKDGMKVWFGIMSIVTAFVAVVGMIGMIISILTGIH